MVDVDICFVCSLGKCRVDIDFCFICSLGKCWMDALELALKCTNLLKRSMTRSETCTPETNSDVTLPIGFGPKVITEIKYTSAT